MEKAILFITALMFTFGSDAIAAAAQETINLTSIDPEPSIILLFGTVLLGLAAIARKRYIRRKAILFITVLMLTFGSDIIATAAQETINLTSLHPAPSIILLFGAGLIGLSAIGRKKFIRSEKPGGK
jgi:hypothetical protein